MKKDQTKKKITIGKLVLNPLKCLVEKALIWQIDNKSSSKYDLLYLILEYFSTENIEKLFTLSVMIFEKRR